MREQFAQALQLEPIAVSTKVLIVSPCQGGYGGIEAFVLAVAAAVRREPDFEVRICLKRTKGAKLQPNLKAMLKGEDVILCDRADRDLTPGDSLG